MNEWVNYTNHGSITYHFFLKVHDNAANLLCCNASLYFFLSSDILLDIIRGAQSASFQPVVWQLLKNITQEQTREDSHLIQLYNFFYNDYPNPVIPALASKMWVQLPFKLKSPELTRQEHKITRELNPPHWLAVLATNLRKSTVMAKVSRHPWESLGGRWDTVGGRGNRKGGHLAHKEQMDLDALHLPYLFRQVHRILSSHQYAQSSWSSQRVY